MGAGPLTWGYEQVEGGFLASVVLPGSGEIFKGHGLSKVDAKNAAAAMAVEAIYGNEAEVAAPSSGIGM